MSPDFHVFYCRQRTGEVINSYDPQPMSLVHIVDFAWRVLESTGDFLGLVDKEDNLLQCLYLARSEGDLCPIRMEIADRARRGSYTRQVSARELQDVLRRLPERLCADAVPGLRFESGPGR